MSDAASVQQGIARPTELPIRLIDEKGAPVRGKRTSGFAIPDASVLLGLYRQMVVARRFEAQVTALTRQGRLATYPSALGQEACEIASVAALESSDWLFPTYRDTIALLTRGVSASQILAFFRGEWHVGFDPMEHHVSPQSTPLATQALHAVGFATASKLKGESTIALTYLGDGSTSEGDAHEAFNFASVWQAPVVVLVQNNQYAISVPIAKQAHARVLADRALGYGMPGYYVDGNDVAAMFAVISAAAARARSGGGPTLIEGLTYRMESHTNSDDPTHYRTVAESEEWRGHDPIDRLEKYLTMAGLLTPEITESILAESEALATATRDAMNQEPVIDPLELFDHVYSTPRAALQEQRAFLAGELASALPATSGRPS